MGRRMDFGRYDYGSFLAFMNYSASSIIVPVALVGIASALNFPLKEGGLGAGGALQLGRSFMMVLAMVFSGFIAGKIGARKTLGWALLVMAFGIALAAFSPVYGVLFAALAFAGLGEGVIEGIATPFVGDLHPQEPGRYINFAHGFWSVGIVLAVLISGWLLQIGVNWRYVILGVGLCPVIPGILILWKPSSHGQQFPERKKSVPVKVVAMRGVKIMMIPKFWLYFAAMIFAGGGEYGLTFWSASLIQTEFGGSAFMGGLGTAIFSCGMVLGRTGYGFLINENYLKPLILINAACGIVLGLFFPSLNSLSYLLVLLFPIGIASAPFWPSIQTYASKQLKVDNTMLFILLSCAGVPGCGIITYLMGYVGDEFGFKESFYLVPACYLLMGILIFFERSGKLKEK